MMSVYNIHENLIEVLLEMQSYPDVQAVLSKYDGKFTNKIFSKFLNLNLSELFFKRHKSTQVGNHLFYSSFAQSTSC
jgi:hypothetical protein